MRRARVSGVCADRTSRCSSGTAGAVRVWVPYASCREFAAYSSYSSTTMCALVPPIPKELIPARRGPSEVHGRASTGITNGPADRFRWLLGVSKPATGGISRCRRHSRTFSSPASPAAGFQMPDVALHGPDVARLATVRVTAEDLGQRGDLDRVAEPGRRTVRLDEGDVRGCEPGIVQRRTYDGGLGLAAGHRHGAAAAPVVDGCAADDAPDPVAVPFGVREGSQHEGQRAFAGEESVGPLVEGPRPGVGEGTELAEAAVVPGSQTDLAGRHDRGAAVSGAQRGDRLLNGDEGRRAQGVDGLRGTGQVQCVGDPVGQYRVHGAERGVRSDGLKSLRVAVMGVGGADEDADVAAAA